MLDKLMCSLRARNQRSFYAYMNFHSRLTARLCNERCISKHTFWGRTITDEHFAQIVKDLNNKFYDCNYCVYEGTFWYFSRWAPPLSIQPYVCFFAFLFWFGFLVGWGVEIIQQRLSTLPRLLTTRAICAVIQLLHSSTSTPRCPLQVSLEMSTQIVPISPCDILC